MPLDTLMGGLKAARLVTGEAISPAAARQLACEAGIIPAVLGGASEVLDLGRARFYNKAQRLAKLLETRGCQVTGCDSPPHWTHMHHPTPWSRGGTTGPDGLMLCPHHHTLAHDTRYQMQREPTGHHTFHRRT